MMTRMEGEGVLFFSHRSQIPCIAYGDMSAFGLNVGNTEDFAMAFLILPEANFVPDAVDGKPVLHYYAEVPTIRAGRGFNASHCFMTRRGTFHTVDTDLHVVRGRFSNSTAIMKRVSVTWAQAATQTFSAPPPNAALGVAFDAANGCHDMLRSQIERIGFLSEEACAWVDQLPSRLRLDFQRGYETVLKATGIHLKGPVMKFDRQTLIALF